MSAAAEPRFDPARALEVLSRHSVDFVLVGGLAGQAWGATRLTRDLDICPAWRPENLERLAAALEELEARLKIGEGSIEMLEVALDARTISNMEIGAWRTVAGDIDVLLGIPAESRTKLARYEQLLSRASVLVIGGARVSVASLADIIRSKEVSDRPKDRVALPELQRLSRRSADA
jgi:hypothetical protein